MKKSICIILAALFLMAGTASAGPKMGAEVTFEWDANTEADLAGYKIYQGRVSRFSNALDPKVIVAKLQERCENMPEDLIEQCKQSWASFCSAKDPLCDHDYFAYENIVDVKNVTEYTVKGIGSGKWFFAATAYDDQGNESKFSEELDITINLSKPGSPKNFKVTLTAKGVTVEIAEPD